MSKRRYIGLFIVPGMCDGVFDTRNDPHYEHPLDFEKMISIMNDTNNEIEVWKSKYDEMKEKYERCRNGKKKKE